MSGQQRFGWLLPVVAAVAAFALAPWAGLVWDDETLLRYQLSAFGTLRDVLVPPDGITRWSYAYYRPVVLLSYLLDVRLFGAGATAGPHAVNVACHAAVTYGAWRLLQRLLAGRPRGGEAALVGALLFAVHPIHAESVLWIAGRSDLLAALFLLSGLLLALRWRDAGSVAALGLSAGAFLLGLLSKEVAIAGLVLLPLVLAGAPAPGGSRRSAAPASPELRRKLIWLAAGIAWLGAAWAYFDLRTFGQTALPEPAAGSWTRAAWMVLRPVAFYLEKLFWPWPQSHFVVWERLPAALGTSAVIIITAALAAWAWRRWRRGADPTVLLGMAWIAVTLAPALLVAFTPIAPAPAAERYLYLPSVGAAIVLAGLWSALVTPARVGLARALCGLLGAVYLALCWERNFVWLDDVRLWADAARHSPEHSLPWIELGQAQQRAGDAVAAEQSFARARRNATTPQLRAIAAHSLGMLALERAEARAAAALFREAIADDGDYAPAYYGLGRSLFEQSRQALPGSAPQRAAALLQEAIRQQETALRINPAFAGARLELARGLAVAAEALAAQGAHQAAAENFRRASDEVEQALATDPLLAGQPQVERLRSMLLLMSGRVREPP